MKSANTSTASGDPDSPVSGWRAEELEVLGRCPLCNSPHRHALHSDLSDITFGSPGRGWTVWSCTPCGAAYLDPRPHPSSIHRAYAQYYTHQDSGLAARRASSHGPRAGLGRRAIGAYLRSRFGCRTHPEWAPGAWLVRALPSARRKYDRDFRHLPMAPEGGRLLDVGCGNGDFLAVAQCCGWAAVGVDPDPRAVEQARSRGLQAIPGGIDEIVQAESGESGFEVITLSHVIEHLHEPRHVLAQCLRLLKPGGRLWLETPNARAIGHHVFGSAWRGLECPRHLVLFDGPNLARTLMDAGFEGVRPLPRNSALRPLYKDSLALAEGRSAQSRRKLSWREHLHMLTLLAWEAWDPSRAEVLTMEAYRPGPTA